MVVLACFVVPVGAAFVYVIGGGGPTIADLIAAAVILPLIGIGAKRRIAKKDQRQAG